MVFNSILALVRSQSFIIDQNISPPNTSSFSMIFGQRQTSTEIPGKALTAVCPRNKEQVTEQCLLHSAKPQLSKQVCLQPHFTFHIEEIRYYLPTQYICFLAY